MPTKSSSTPTTPTYDSLIRISKVGDRKRDGSLMSDDQQRDANARAIREHGGRVGRVIPALNVSGGDVFSSEQWSEALARVRAGKSAGVAIAYLDRYGRDTAAGLAYTDELAAAGGALIIDGRKVDPDNPEERMMLILGLGQAEYQLRVYKKRSRATMTKVRERGITNRVSYGYMRNLRIDGTLHVPTRDPKMLVPDPATAPTVKRIFAMRAEGARWTDVQRWLEAREVPSPTGARMWTTSTISTLVANRTYLGEVKMGGHVTVKAHQSLVTPDVFARAQSRSGVVRTGRNIAGVAGGLITCGTCGRPLSVAGRGTGKPTFYACRRTYSGGRCAQPVTGDQRSIDNAVDAALREQAERGFEVEVVRLRRELTDAREQLAVAEWDRDQFLEGTAGLTAAVIAKGVRRLQQAVEIAQERVERAEAAATGVAEFPTSGADWDALSLADKREAARSIVESIVLAPFPNGAPKRQSVASDRVTITWRP
jgi:DNA invertase Pin-like site-specific DNA recombinase